MVCIHANLEVRILCCICFPWLACPRPPDVHTLPLCISRPLQSCNATTCLNGGSCEDVNGRAQCKCASGFDGALCNTRADGGGIETADEKEPNWWHDAASVSAADDARYPRQMSVGCAIVNEVA